MITELDGFLIQHPIFVVEWDPNCFKGTFGEYLVHCGTNIHGQACYTFQSPAFGLKISHTTLNIFARIRAAWVSYYQSPKLRLSKHMQCQTDSPEQYTSKRGAHLNHFQCSWQHAAAASLTMKQRETALITSNSAHHRDQQMLWSGFPPLQW